MRKGYDPAIVLNDGKIVGIATGADATTEHECGSKPMLEALCSPAVQDETLIGLLKQGKPVVYPSLLDVKRICRTPTELQWQETAGAEPEAAFGLWSGSIEYYREELRFPTRVRTSQTMDLAGAWDERSFAIRVRGLPYVTAAREFYQAICAGQVAFGGLFFQRPSVRLSGVILVHTERLTNEDRTALGKAQARYESTLRLKAQDDSAFLMAELKKLSGIHHIGFLSARWADSSEAAVVYSLNPLHEVGADYGSYSKDQLIRWARAKCAYHLHRDEAAA